MRTLFLLPAIMLCFFALSNCAGDQEEQIPIEKIEMTDDFGNLEVFARRKSNYAREGLYTKKSPQGAVIEHAYFENDTLDGPRVLYYEQGDTQIVENYQKGVYIGSYRFYYPSGQLQQEGRYENNQMTGSWNQYFENGQLKETVRFENNQENGPFTEYYENGNLKAEGEFKNGAYEQGELKLYNEAGKLVRIMNCEQGICHTQWVAEEEEGK